jgi:hypothetical protein
MPLKDYDPVQIGKLILNIAGIGLDTVTGAKLMKKVKESKPGSKAHKLLQAAEVTEYTSQTVVNRLLFLLEALDNE